VADTRTRGLAPRTNTRPVFAHSHQLARLVDAAECPAVSSTARTHSVASRSIASTLDDDVRELLSAASEEIKLALPIRVEPYLQFLRWPKNESSEENDSSED
jgi:hypothetical protein